MHWIVRPCYNWVNTPKNYQIKQIKCFRQFSSQVNWIILFTINTYLAPLHYLHMILRFFNFSPCQIFQMVSLRHSHDIDGEPDGTENEDDEVDETSGPTVEGVLMIQSCDVSVVVVLCSECRLVNWYVLRQGGSLYPEEQT